MPLKKKMKPAIKAKNNKHNLKILYFLGFILAISSALPAYIQSNFLEQFVSLNVLSLFFIAANAGAIFTIILFPKLIKLLSNYFLTKITLIIYGCSLLGLTMTSNSIGALVNIILFTVSSNLLWINMDILVEGFSENKQTGKIRAFYFTFINLGWIFSPILSAYLISIGGYSTTFIASAALLVPIFFIFLYQGKNLKDKISYSKEAVITVLKRMWTNTNLRGIFFVALLLNLFFSCAVVYIPIYLHRDLQMDWKILGYIFSLMLIPFLVFEIPAGIIADKYLGEKEILFVGFAIITASLFSFYLISSSAAWIWAGVLFVSRIGAALVEAMREAYFFKIVDAKDVGYINIFRITSPIGYILGASIAIFTLFFFPLKFLFLILTILMLSSFYFVYTLKDTK